MCNSFARAVHSGFAKRNSHPMNQSFAAFIRHFLTFLTGVGGLLATAGVLTATDAAAVDGAGASLIAPLSVIGGAIAAGVTRLLLAWLGLAGLAKEILPNDEHDETVEQSGRRLMGWLLLAGLVGSVGFSLPACSPTGSAEMPPIHATYKKDGLAVGYSSKGGLVIVVDEASGK